MSRLVVLVEFDLEPSRFSAFDAAVRENAIASLNDEPGCQQFDVCVPHEGANRIVLYEIYDDEAAFQAHMETTHFKKFDALVKDWITDRKVTKLSLEP